jgi:hypothetical protein
MKQIEPYYRKTRNETFPPRNRTNQPKAWGSLNEDTEQRIVMLYTNGQSIESITKEVGRARYLVVHVLQSRGVFGNCRTEPDREVSRIESIVVEDVKEELVIDKRKPESIALKARESQIAMEEPPGKVKRFRKSKSSEQLKSLTVEKQIPKPPGLEKSSVKDRWSPLLVDVLCKVVAQHDLNTGMTLEDVQRMVSGSKR